MIGKGKNNDLLNKTDALMLLIYDQQRKKNPISRGRTIRRANVKVIQMTLKRLLRLEISTGALKINI